MFGLNMLFENQLIIPISAQPDGDGIDGLGSTLTS